MNLVRHITLCLAAAAAALPGAAAAQQQPPAAAQEPQQFPAPIVRRTPRPAKPPILVDQFGRPIPSPIPEQHHLTEARPVTPKSTTPAQQPTLDINGNPITPPKHKPKPRPNPAPFQALNPASLVPAPAGPFNRTTVLIDPAHGGGDTGARFTDDLTEKDVTLALAFKLRSLLSARGFTVLLTRDNDSPASSPGTPLTLDDRAGLANHARPAACLLLHATASGTGVHLYTSELQPTPAELPAAPWLTAQAPWIPQSQRLAAQLTSALNNGKIPLVASRASVRPIDSLTCPATVVELAPEGDDADTLNDNAYQQRVANALAAALVFWQNAAVPPTRLVPPPPKPKSLAPETTPASTPAETPAP